MAALGAERKNVVLPRTSALSLENGHSRHGHPRTRFAPTWTGSRHCNVMVMARVSSMAHRWQVQAKAAESFRSARDLCRNHNSPTAETGADVIDRSAQRCSAPPPRTSPRRRPIAEAGSDCHRSISAKMLSAAAAHVAAPTSIAVWKATHSSSPSAASTAPRSAVATRPPVRATALFRPDADPA